MHGLGREGVSRAKAFLLDVQVPVGLTRLSRAKRGHLTAALHATVQPGWFAACVVACTFSLCGSFRMLPPRRGRSPINSQRSKHSPESLLAPRNWLAELFMDIHNRHFALASAPNLVPSTNLLLPTSFYSSPFCRILIIIDDHAAALSFIPHHHFSYSAFRGIPGISMSPSLEPLLTKVAGSR